MVQPVRRISPRIIETHLDRATCGSRAADPAVVVAAVVHAAAARPRAARGRAESLYARREIHGDVVHHADAPGNGVVEMVRPAGWPPTPAFAPGELDDRGGQQVERCERDPALQSSRVQILAPELQALLRGLCVLKRSDRGSRAGSPRRHRHRTAETRHPPAKPPSSGGTRPRSARVSLRGPQRPNRRGLVADLDHLAPNSDGSRRPQVGPDGKHGHPQQGAGIHRQQLVEEHLLRVVDRLPIGERRPSGGLAFNQNRSAPAPRDSILASATRQGDQVG
jgi:hypothetical protein